MQNNTVAQKLLLLASQDMHYDAEGNVNPRYTAAVERCRARGEKHPMVGGISGIPVQFRYNVVRELSPTQKEAVLARRAEGKRTAPLREAVHVILRNYGPRNWRISVIDAGANGVARGGMTEEKARALYAKLQHHVTLWSLVHRYGFRYE